jgi:hypothetical protein
MQNAGPFPGASPAPGPPSDTSVKLVNDASHPYKKQRPHDIRGPCPGLNTLASHGVRVTLKSTPNFSLIPSFVVSPSLRRCNPTTNCDSGARWYYFASMAHINLTDLSAFQGLI